MRFAQLVITLIVILLSHSLFAQKPMVKRSFEIVPEAMEDLKARHLSTINPLNGMPLSIQGRLVSEKASDSESIAREFLTRHSSDYGLRQEDLNKNLKVYFIRKGLSGDVVRLRQYVQDIPVFQSEITLHVNKNNQVSYVANALKYDMEIKDLEPLLTMSDARGLVEQQISLNGPIYDHDESLILFPMKNKTHLAYRIWIHTDHPSGAWEGIVDAHTGEILQLKDIAFYYKDHKAALHESTSTKPLRWHPPMRENILTSATGSGNVFDPDPLSSAGASYNDPGYTDGGDANTTQLTSELMNVTLNDITLSGGMHSLVGPWAEIQDFESPFRGLFSQASSTFNFDRNAAGFEAVNTYYHVDASMRYLNVTLGLNIKPSAYPGGVRFDPHGLNGSDNSHYLGGSQRISFGEGGVDDAEDSDVIHHELGHGLHDWVTGGGLSQVQGLSEGSGDYWCASYNRGLGLWISADPAYYFTFNWDGHNPFWNGRSVNYRPATPAYPGGLVGQIHTDGQIWATCMMDVWDAIGQQETDIIFWEGLGMTNGSSNQNAAANAVYQAAIDMGYFSWQLSLIHENLTACGYTLPALPSCIVPGKIAQTVGTYTANYECTDSDGWTHYIDNRSTSTTADDLLLLSIQKNGVNVGTIGDGTFLVQTTLEPEYNSGLGIDLTASGYVTDPIGWFASSRWFNVTPNGDGAGGQIAGPVEVRYYYDDTEIADLNGSVANAGGSITYTPSDLTFYKVNAANPAPTVAIHNGLTFGADYLEYTPGSSTVSSYQYMLGSPLGFTANDHIAQFMVNSFSGGGIGAGGASFGALPVDLITFTAQRTKEGVALDWKTSNEVNNRGFEIQRSVGDAEHFEKIGWVDGQGTTSHASNYTWVDKGLTSNQTYYYRLAQMDFDLSTTFIAIRKIRIGEIDESIQIYPVPARDRLFIRTTGIGDKELILYDVHGQHIKLKDTELKGTGVVEMNISHIPAGIYMMHILSSDSEPEIKYVIVN